MANDKNEMTEGQRVAYARVLRALTQRGVAQAMTERGFAWTQSTVAKIEGGSRRLWLDESAALREVLAVDLDFLAGVSAELPEPELFRVEYERLSNEVGKVYRMLAPLVRDA